MASKAISIELGTKQRAILQQQLDTGRYENASEVMNDALRLMSEREAVFDEWLRQDVRASLADKQSPLFKRLRGRVNRTAKAAKAWPIRSYFVAAPSNH